MTENFEIETAKTFSVAPTVQDGNDGYNLSFPGQVTYFLPEDIADDLGRYFLFGKRGGAPDHMPVDHGEDPDEDPIDASPVPEVQPQDTEPTHVDAPKDTPPVAT